MPLEKLNLGCGWNPMHGYWNVDKYGNPDEIHDLEVFPWPWADNTYREVVLTHVLEHLGETTDKFLGIMKELYRVCMPDALVKITVPHPRHDDFLNDPTHVRVITPELMGLFSKRLNHKWKSEGYSNSTLGLYIDVDFETVSVSMNPDDSWQDKLKKREISHADFVLATTRFNNVIKDVAIVIKAVKEKNGNRP